MDEGGLQTLNPIQDAPFRGCSRMGGGGQKGPPTQKSVTYILQVWNVAGITYLKKTQKINESRDTVLEIFWHQHFFTGTQQLLLYQKIQL